MLTRRCPQAVAVSNPDRCQGGATAVREHGADTIVLDDGFQHRRLGRNLDIVLIDATCPFGYERLLPRGLLREPLSSLRRADVLVITRADQVPAPELQALRERLARLAAGKPVLRAIHHATGLVTLNGALVDAAAAPRRPVLFAAIARPAAFERTARDMGRAPADACWYPDHHAYTAADAAALCDRVRRNDADALLTTEKDAAKLERLQFDWPCPVLAVRIDIAFLEDDATIMADLVRRAVARA
jgi:tetraacyldisaccharide 4'-kinase